MGWGKLHRTVLWLLAALLAAATPAFAHDFSPGSVCHTTADAHDGDPALAADAHRWNCESNGWSIARQRAVLRFDLSGRDERPAALTTRLTRFDSMRIVVTGARGTLAESRVTEAEMRPATTDWMMSAPLPQVGASATAIYVEVIGARHVGMLSDLRLTDAPATTASTLRHELLIALLCGMLCMPLLFNVAFYRVLQGRFLLWHALSTVFMLVHTLLTSGLINRFATLSLDALSFASALSFGAGIVAASLFSADLIEADKLDRVHRRLLRGVGLWVLPWTLFYLLADGPLRPVAAPLYLASFLPLMGLFAWVMFVAKRRGSRAVHFQLVAWLPLMLTGLVRIVSSLGFTDAPMELLLEQHFAMGLEVIITSLGAVDRLLVIRRERDVALAEMRVFERRAERDPLTGLFNRRAVEQRFAELCQDGFRAMAAIDLDKFKDVNDRHGHVTGDAVLRAAAAALAPDSDTIVVRMGGEEFLLLMRGHDIHARAERRRQAISSRVAADVPGLDRIVTASMGLVEHAAGTPMRGDFATLYAHCDRLLYEAKHTGRNRTLHAKVQSFGRPTRRARAA